MISGPLFWLAVALTAIASVVIFKVVATKVPWQPLNILAAAV